MRKIPTLFERDPEHRSRVLPTQTVTLPEDAIPTRKYDGTSVLVEGGKVWKRHEVKRGKTPPPDFRPADEIDDVTGKQPGWVPVGDGPDDRWHREAMWLAGDVLPDGTYELVGPKVQGNPEGYEGHEFVRHGEDVLPDVPRDFDGLRDYLLARRYEGIVWWADGRPVAKIKRRDFA